MTSKKQPNDATPATGTTDENGTEVTTEETPLTLLERVKLLKSRQQLSHPDPRSIYKGAKIGNGPRNTRRSMGKR